MILGHCLTFWLVPHKKIVYCINNSNTKSRPRHLILKEAEGETKTQGLCKSIWKMSLTSTTLLK